MTHPADRVLVVHVQRTGGTSLREALVAAHGSGAVYPSRNVLAARPDGRYESAAELLERWHSVPRSHPWLGGSIAPDRVMFPGRRLRAW